MPWPKKSRPKAARVVRHTLADGTVREYRYEAYRPPKIVAPTDTLAALIDAYLTSPKWRDLAPKTRQVYALYLRVFQDVDHVPVASIRRRQILDIHDKISTARGNGAATGFLRTAQALFSWAVDREWIETSPVTRIKPIPGGHLRAWTPAEAAKAIAGLPEYLRRVVILAMYTGQRRGDLCAMGWTAYDGRAIRLTQQKTGTPLVLPVHPVLKAELDAWRPGAGATTILTNTLGRPWEPQQLSHALPVALARLGLPPDLNVHGLRKLAAANLADAGCSVHEIAAVTGHRSLGMVQFYTRSADQERLAGAAIVRLRDGGKR